MAEKLMRILYIEDEPDIQEVARLALEMVGGFTVEVCSSGADALEKAPLFKPQLILSDVMMPGMDGATTLKKLRELAQTEKTPAIFMTAKVQQGEIEQYREMGAVDVIAKPFDPMTLASKVEEIWERCSG